MSKKPKVDDGHRQGQRCGYTLKEDGRIIPAPMYAESFEKLSTEQHGINNLMKLFTSHCADLLAEIQRRQKKLWDQVCEDYGLDKETHSISYDGTYITVKPKPAPDSATAEPTP